MTSLPHRARDVFLEAVDITPPDRRAAFLDRACAGDGELRRRVEALLAAHERPECLLDRPAVALARADAGLAGPLEGPGAVLGPYTLLERLGEGGMGVVFRAEQAEPVRREVALKLVRPGMDTEHVLARFAAEREALERMEHPNIARVLDAGATRAGRPYFVIELVRGVPITGYCDEARLAPRQRLELFIAVCAAIQHAHQKSTVHRDIKPSNVLIAEVDGKPVPKVIDFGVAKAIDQQRAERTLFTRHGAIVGTPEYMSPEQAGAGPDVDTRTDVYSLGVLLYELLTGTTPLDRESLRRTALDEVLKRVREEDPPRPSTRLSDTNHALPSVAAARATEPAQLARLVRGDLDWIVMKALEKDRDRRYETVSGLARDLRRYLDGDPVEARPPSRLYRLRKLARKHRTRLSTVGAFALVLAAGAIAARWQASRLDEARRIARQRQQEIHRRDAEIEQRQYVADIRRASTLITLGSTAWMARDLLDRHRPANGDRDLCEFEWYYLRNLTAADLASWAGHEGREVYHVEFAPDGRTFATGGGDGTARVWDAETRQQRLVLRGHQADVNWVSFDPAGRRIVTAGDDGKVRVWDAADGKELAVLDGFTRPVVAALFMPDGRDVIAAARDGLHVRWEPATGQRHATGRPSIPIEGDWAETLAISPDGRMAAVTGKNQVVIFWDLSQGGLTPFAGPYAPMWTNGQCVAFAPDGRTVAASLSGRTHIALYDVHNGETVSTLQGPASSTFGLAFAPDGETLAACDDGTNLRVWDLRTRTCRAILMGHTARIWSVAFAPDGRSLVTTSGDGTIRTWDAAGHSERAVFRGLRRDPRWSEAVSLAFSEDGSRLLAANRAADVLECDLVAGESRVLRTGETSPRHGFVSLAPNGTSLAVHVDTDTIRLYDLVGGRSAVSVASPRSVVEEVAWSTDGKRFALTDRLDHLTLWDTAGRSLGQINAVRGANSSRPVFMPAGDVVIMVSGDGPPRSVPCELIVWGPARSRVDRHPVPVDLHPVNKMVVAPDGRTLWSDWGLWDLASSPRHRSHLVGHGEAVLDTAFSADSRTVATASADHTVRLWNVATGEELLTLEGHTGPVRVLAFSPDGSALASGGDGPDGSIEVIVWRAAPPSHRSR